MAPARSCSSRTICSIFFSTRSPAAARRRCRPPPAGSCRRAASAGARRSAPQRQEIAGQTHGLRGLDGIGVLITWPCRRGQTGRAKDAVAASCRRNSTFAPQYLPVRTTFVPLWAYGRQARLTAIWSRLRHAKGRWSPQRSNDSGGNNPTSGSVLGTISAGVTDLSISLRGVLHRALSSTNANERTY
jgi:hypothetical protein